MTLDLSVYLVTDTALARAAGHRLPELVAAAVDGGVRTVQVREKDASADDFLATVLDISAVVPRTVSVIVNDSVDVFLAARDAGAHVAGVHVGQDDLPLSAVRELVGPEAIVGVSAATEAELADACRVPGLADYVGIGVLHPTPTKADAPPALGHRRFGELVRASTVPVVAIGGVSAADLPELRSAGAAGAAVVSAICSAADPLRAARHLRATWDGAR